MVTFEATQCLSKILYLLVGIFKQSTKEVHTKNNDDLNIKVSHQAEVMEDNVDFFPSNSIKKN